jgi:hypothetical protein
MRGISAIFAIVFVLLIAVALTGIAAAWSVGVLPIMYEPVEAEEIAYLRARACLNIDSVDLKARTLVVRNCGFVPLADLKLYIDYVQVQADFPPKLDPQQRASVGYEGEGAEFWAIADLAESPIFKPVMPPPPPAFTFIENFSTTTYRDMAATDARWDTANQKLMLRINPFLPYYILSKCDDMTYIDPIGTFGYPGLNMTFDTSRWSVPMFVSLYSSCEKPGAMVEVAIRAVEGGAAVPPDLTNVSVRCDEISFAGWHNFNVFREAAYALAPDTYAIIFRCPDCDPWRYGNWWHFYYEPIPGPCLNPGVVDALDYMFRIYTPRFYMSGRAQSLKISIGTARIVKAKLTAFQELGGPGAVIYWLSADGGAHWEEVISGQLHTFTNPGNDLRWRANLSTTDDIFSPLIDELRIEYWTD